MTLALIALAHAQDVTGGDVPDLNAQTFRPSIDGDRLLWLDDAGKRMDQEFVGRFLFQYLDDPLVYETEDGQVTKVVASVFQADLLGGYQVGPARFGLDVPVYLFATSDVVAGQGGLGDLALDTKLSAPLEDAPLDLAASFRATFPTATVSTALGNPRVGWEITAIASRAVGPVLLAANLGTRGAPEASLENLEGTTDLNDYFVARLGAGYAFGEVTTGTGLGDYGAGLEMSWQVPYSAPMATAEGWPLEFLASGYGYAAQDVVVRGGVGSGLSPGVGSPDARLLLGVGYEPRPVKAPEDTDGDGLVDDVDQCPTDPEDPDSFQDENGCPDPDNDADGIVDPSDQCMNEPEDRDGWKDEEGCPDPTTLVKVAVVDKETQQPLGIAKVAIACGEQRQGGVAPLEAEFAAGRCTVGAAAGSYARLDLEFDVVNGPPMEVKLELEPQKAAMVTVSRDRIELKDSIRFQTGKAVIQPASFPMLDQAVQILADYPEIKKLRIEGHTDERGSDATNLELSKKRAKAVLDYLVGKGIDPARLTSEGFGESRPIDPGHDEAAWSKNRRTDFFVELWEEAPVQGAVPAPQ